MQVKMQQLEPDMEQWTGSKLEKEYFKTVCCHPFYLTCMHSLSWKMLGWMNHKLESIAGRNVNLRYSGDTTLMAESEEELKSLLIWTKEESDKAVLKLNIQKIKIMASDSITSWQIDREKWK